MGKTITYIKFQMVALLSTLVDFFILVFATEYLHWWYMYSAALALIIGGIVAFYLNRFWVFKSVDIDISGQIIRYILTSIGNMLLNLLIIYTFTQYLGIMYIISKMIAALGVGLIYSFFVNRFWVFYK
jgi:putative flippase GtrA